MKLVLIIADALRSDYLREEYMPFLYSLCHTGIYVEEVIPSPGYCERTEILTGMTPRESNNFTSIGFCPDKSDYRYSQTLLNGFSYIERASKSCARIAANKYFGRKGFLPRPYNIPFKALSRYCLTEDMRAHIEKDAFIGESLFDVMKLEEKSFAFEFYPSLRNSLQFKTMEEMLQGIKQHIELGTDFIPVYLGEADALGHLYADDILKMEGCLLHIDNQIETIYSYISTHSNEYGLMILGDHGMVPVNTWIDFYDVFRTVGLKAGVDYDLFLDSVYARLWFYNTKAKDLMCEKIENNLSEYGELLDLSSSDNERLPLLAKALNEKQSLYGDLIWCASPGVVIVPDYFGSTTDTHGMHGYLRKSLLGNGLMVLLSDSVNPCMIPRCDLIDICPTIADIMGIRIPLNNKGKSLVLKGRCNC